MQTERGCVRRISRSARSMVGVWNEAGAAAGLCDTAALLKQAQHRLRRAAGRTGFAQRQNDFGQLHADDFAADLVLQ